MAKRRLNKRARAGAARCRSRAAARRRQSPSARPRQCRRQKSAQFLFGARRRGAVVGEMHAQNDPAAGGSGIVEQMAGAGQNDEPRRGGARRLRGDERSAIRGRRHRIGRADEDEGRNLERLALAVGAGRVIGGGGAQARAARRRGGDRQRDVAALREADDGDAPGVDERLTREIGERRRRVGRADGKIDRTGLVRGRAARIRRRTARHSPSSPASRRKRRGSPAGRGRNGSARRRETARRRRGAVR